MRGTDVVVTAFGMSTTGGGVSPHAQEDGARNILAAMTSANVSRLVYLGNNWVSKPTDQWDWFASAVYTALSYTILSAVAADAVKAFALLEAAPPNIQWYFIRAPLLSDGPGVTNGDALHKLRLGDANVGAGSPASKLTRADTAQILLEFAVKPEAVASWVRKAPVATL